MAGDEERRRQLSSEIAAAGAPENFPRWAQACPRSFGELKQAMLLAAVEMAKLERIPTPERERLAQIMGHVAATCFAAGRASIKEGRENGLEEITG